MQYDLIKSREKSFLGGCDRIKLIRSSLDASACQPFRDLSSGGGRWIAQADVGTEDQSDINIGDLELSLVTHVGRILLDEPSRILAAER
jgi:hypothetical protein